MLRLSMYSTKGPSGQRRKSLRRHPAAVATSREGHRPLIRLVRLLYAGHVPVARGRFAYEHLRPAISYSRVRTGQTLRQCRAVAIFGLVVDLRARSDWSALLTVSIFAPPGLHTPPKSHGYFASEGGPIDGPLLLPGCPGILEESCWRTARL
jgi:hypothetical protein